MTEREIHTIVGKHGLSDTCLRTARILYRHIHPQASGTASANLSFVSNASNMPTVESLGGSGTPPP